MGLSPLSTTLLLLSPLSTTLLLLSPLSTTPPLLSPLSTTMLPTPSLLPMLLPPPPSDTPTPPTLVCAPTTRASRLPAKLCRDPPSSQYVHLRHQQSSPHHSSSPHVWVEGHPSCDSLYLLNIFN